MPIVSVFFGIVIRLYHADHNPPHFHATYGDFEAIIEVKTGKILGGSLPPKGRKLVEEWRKLHVSELNAAWLAVSAMKTPKRIKGLE
jgi:hypothetical protein